MPDRPPATRGAPVVNGARRLVSRPAASVATRAAAVVLAGALVATGLGEVADRREQAALAAAALAAHRAEVAELARRDRASAADVSRLTGAALQYAAMRRAEALAAARAAVQVADAVVVTRSASPDVPAETLAPLGQAAASLEALIDQTVGAPSGAEGADPGGAVPGADVPAEAPGLDPRAAPVEGPAAAPATPGAVPGGDPAATGGPSPADDAGADEPDRATRPPGTQEQTDALRTLDLTVSAEVLAAAHRVTDLSAEVQVAADAAVAAADAQREAERLAEETRLAEAAALAVRVRATDEAPNGRIPTDLLCAPEAAPDALLRCDAAQALDRLAAAYRADVGRDLVVVSSYRSFDAQVAVRATRGALAAEPGRSNHGRALAVDFAGFGGLGDFTAAPYRWMKEHAAAFGWHHPAAMEPGGSAPQEPWHWEFGTQDATSSQRGGADAVASRPDGGG